MSEAAIQRRLSQPQEDLPEDSQGQAAAGWNSILRMLSNQYQQGGERIHQALQGDPATNPETRAALMDLGQTAAMSTIGKVEKSLPMDEASRMARAKEMGFDTGTTYYHGTQSEFDKFKPSTSNGAYGHGIYLTPDPEVANNYAAGNAPILGASYGAGENVIPTHVDTSNFADLSEGEFHNAVREFLNNHELPEDEIGRIMESPGRISDFLKSQGYTGAFLPDHMGDQQIVVFDPSKIRSKFAAFDPSKAGSGNISAGLGAIGLGAMARRMQHQGDQQ